jgi:hypothetical protein
MLHSNPTPRSLTETADMDNANAAGQTLRVLQRVVFPTEDFDVVPLYVETNIDRGAHEPSAATCQPTWSRRSGPGGAP